jgi:hypothetical protein
MDTATQVTGRAIAGVDLTYGEKTMANEPTSLTRDEILRRPGWTRGRIERVLSPHDD